MPHIEVLPLGELQTNCYLVWDQDPERVVVVDPGDDIPALRRALQGREAAGVLITHAHFDHILGLPAVADKPIYVHALDAAAMTDPALNCSDRPTAVPATNTVEEGDTVSLGGLDFTVLHTPGHTPGSVCYRCGNDLFTGDTLFVGGYGRTDLPGGDWRQMGDSLRRLIELHGLVIHPGHGGSGRIP